MLVPFGTHVLDRDGRSVGTVSRLVLHPESRQVVALVVQQGVIDRREVVVPLSTVAQFGDEVRLELRATDLAGLDIFEAPHLRPLPDHWPMPMGFDQRGFFLVAADGWTEAVLPFQLVSPAVAGTPAYIPDPEAPEGAAEPAIAVSTPVYDSTGQRIGEVEGAELDHATGRITRVIVRRGRLFRTETPSRPASSPRSATSASRSASGPTRCRSWSAAPSGRSGRPGRAEDRRRCMIER
jgi:sporulation protein YlmC with PRC-barrel domain